MLVQASDPNRLLAAGLGVRSLAALLSKRGVADAGLSGILLTHEHTDHSIGAGPISRRTGATVFGNAATLAAALAKSAETDARAVPTGHEFNVGELEVRAFPVHHDAAEPVGYQLGYGSQRICFLTDTGRLRPDPYRERAQPSPAAPDATDRAPPHSSTLWTSSRPSPPGSPAGKQSASPAATAPARPPC